MKLHVKEFKLDVPPGDDAWWKSWWKAGIIISVSILCYQSPEILKIILEYRLQESTSSQASDGMLQELVLKEDAKKTSDSKKE